MGLVGIAYLGSSGLETLVIGLSMAALAVALAFGCLFVGPLAFWAGQAVWRAWESRNEETTGNAAARGLRRQGTRRGRSPHRREASTSRSARRMRLARPRSSAFRWRAPEKRGKNGKNSEKRAAACPA